MNAGITMTWMLQFNPEFSDSFWSDVAAGIDDTRSFPGCRRAAMYRNQEDANQIMLTSDWDSLGDYRKYSAWLPQAADASLASRRVSCQA